MEQHQARYEGTQRGAVHPALTPRQQEGNWLPFTSAVQETIGDGNGDDVWLGFGNGNGCFLDVNGGSLLLGELK